MLLVPSLICWSLDVPSALKIKPDQKNITQLNIVLEFELLKVAMKNKREINKDTQSHHSIQIAEVLRGRKYHYLLAHEKLI